MNKLHILSAVISLWLLASCKGKGSSSATDSTQMDSDVKLSARVQLDTMLAPKNVTDIKVLYGTDRKLINRNGEEIQFGNQPANPGSKEYSVGYTIVSIPPIDEKGHIETHSWYKVFSSKNDTLKYMVEKKIALLTDKDFNSMLSNVQNGKDAFIFVHGYNNSFQDAALRTAQLAEDIHLPITPIMFSWSSNKKTVDYPGDEDKVQLAVPAFKDFIKRVAKNGHFINIHLIAHSMGNRLISLAMQQLDSDTTNLKIDQIIMAAPDVYADLFKLDYADALIKRSKHITIYSAKNDWALLASKKLHGDLRLGEIGIPPPAYVFNNVDIIDAVNEKTDFLGHDRFARSPVIIADMDSILKSDQTAAQRKILNRMYGSYRYYYFK